MDRREQLSTTMFKLAKINPEIRSFQLTVEEINRLVSAYKYLCEKHPEIESYDYRASKKIVSKKLTKSISVQDFAEN
ncbi:hypothetical protein TSAR_006661 [Trichomalopsis sarcophagae]|uniref:Uncharacterized protein n=1 Tax=Trichomalopsis sarcophagae TaxID=543379 RepID=A0A232EX38_9HYME|nr:hypothetical protein TSAR_006661 [Trichomalopsis sarcophagae]